MIHITSNVTGAGLNQTIMVTALDDPANAPVLIEGVFTAGSAPAIYVGGSAAVEIRGPMIASVSSPAVVTHGAGKIIVTGPAYSLGEVAAFNAGRWVVKDGYDLAIITQSDAVPPRPIALVSNPWSAPISEGVTYGDRLLATATIASTGAQIAAATTA